MIDLDRLLQQVRSFVDQRVLPEIGPWEQREETPRALVAEMGRLGLFGMLIPEAHGGLGLSYRQYARVMHEIERGCGSFRSMLSIQNSLVASALRHFGTPEQQALYLPRMARGEVLAAFALSEASAGSNPAELRTQADGLRLTGEKMWIGNAGLAGVMLVFARELEHGGRSQEDGGPETDPSSVLRPVSPITCFLVEGGAAGLNIEPVKGKLGLRAANPCQIRLEGVEAAGVLGERGRGMKVALYALDRGRLSAAIAGQSVSELAFAYSLAYAQTREQFGKPIAGHQLVQELLVDMHQDVLAGRGLVERALQAEEAGSVFTEEAASAKLFTSEAANRNAYRAIQVHGGQGFLEDNHVARLYRDARILPLYEGTSQILKLIVGRQLTGHSAFS
jgi:butyryl-CoA dehydrogenase